MPRDEARFGCRGPGAGSRLRPDTGQAYDAPTGRDLRQSRRDPWEDDLEPDERKNESERLLGRFEGFRRTFTRYGTTDSMFDVFGPLGVPAALRLGVDTP